MSRRQHGDEPFAQRRHRGSSDEQRPFRVQLHVDLLHHGEQPTTSRRESDELRAGASGGGSGVRASPRPSRSRASTPPACWRPATRRARRMSSGGRDRRAARDRGAVEHLVNRGPPAVRAARPQGVDGPWRTTGPEGVRATGAAYPSRTGVSLCLRRCERLVGRPRADHDPRGRSPGKRVKARTARGTLQSIMERAHPLSSGPAEGPSSGP